MFHLLSCYVNKGATIFPESEHIRMLGSGIEIHWGDHCGSEEQFGVKRNIDPKFFAPIFFFGTNGYVHINR